MSTLDCCSCVRHWCGVYLDGSILGLILELAKRRGFLSKRLRETDKKNCVPSECLVPVTGF